MAGLNDDAQWIILMGFVVSFSFFFLAMVLNQSTVVGETTAEGVLEFPKNDIRNVRNIIIQSSSFSNQNQTKTDIKAIALSRTGAVIDYQITSTVDLHTQIDIHYNNGVTAYNETWTSS